MAGDPTPMEYGEPIEHEEWGVVIAETGEAARLLDEHTARIAAPVERDDLILVKRKVTYDPWVVVSK